MAARASSAATPAPRAAAPRPQHRASSSSSSSRVRQRASASASASSPSPPSASIDSETIAAVATPVVPQAGGVAILRLSGDNALAATSRIFRPASSRASLRRGECVSHLALYGDVVDPASGEIVDEALVLPMLAPRSYTTEDVVEIHCHGGSVCVQRVLALLVNAGGDRSGSGTGGARGTDEEDAKDAAIPAVRLARAGEFTLRAFLNGRIDLTQAEAVQSLVSAKTTVAASSALASLRGGLATPVKDARRVCVDLLAELEARLDFDDEMDPLDEDGVATSVERAEAKIREVLATARRGALLDAGVVVAIVGRPNAGKSSLLNAWTRSERAIVTPIAGTTRDVVEASINVRGVPVTLLDTAGIRFGVGIDEVEAMGVERSRAALAGADVVVFVVDASEGWTDGDDDILRGITGERVVIGDGDGDDDDYEDEDAGEVKVGVGGGGEGDDDGVDEWANAMTRLKRVRGGALAEATRRASSSSSSSFSRASGGRTAVLALNKMDTIVGAGGSMTDVMERLPARVKDGAFASTVTLSATRGDGVDDLERALAEVIGGGDVDVEGAAWVANQRQAEALTTALDALSRLKDTIAEGLPVDFWTIDLREAALALGEVTGEDVAEDVLDVIFTKFCIGK